jgi:hypothetical protein
MMKIKIWVLATVNPDELSPAMPKVYGTEAEAKAGFDEAMRGEWTANAPEDDDGNPLPYPGDPRTAHDELANMGRGDSWGTWELTWHTVDVPLPASMQQALAVLSSVGEQTVEDLESGIEDGTYDDVKANTARVAEINAALQTVATEGAAIDGANGLLPNAGEFDNGSDPVFTREDWQAEVANGDTMRGYGEWVLAQREQQS